MGTHYSTETLRRGFEEPGGLPTPDRRSHDMRVLCPMRDHTWDGIQDKICNDSDCEYGTCAASLTVEAQEDGVEPVESHRYIYEIGEPGTVLTPFPGSDELMEFLVQEVAECMAFREHLDEDDDEGDEEDDDEDE